MDQNTIVLVLMLVGIAVLLALCGFIFWIIRNQARENKRLKDRVWELEGTFTLRDLPDGEYRIGECLADLNLPTTLDSPVQEAVTGTVFLKLFPRGRPGEFLYVLAGAEDSVTIDFEIDLGVWFRKTGTSITLVPQEERVR